MALAADRTVKTRNVGDLKNGNLVVATGVTVYIGSLIEINSNQQIILCADLGAAGYFVGISTQHVVGDGTLTCEYEYDMEALLPCSTDVTYAAINKSVYAADDETVQMDADEGPCIGVLKEMVTTTSAWFHLCGAALAANT